MVITAVAVGTRGDVNPDAKACEVYQTFRSV